MSRQLAAHDRVATFIRAWRRRGLQPTVSAIHDAELLVVDLETLLKPRVVIRTLAHLQALAVGTIIVVQSGRAAQIDTDYGQITDDGEFVEGTRIFYVGTDLYDNLTDPSKEERDTLRRMLPAIVVDPLD
jgi:hypothetical protein